MKISQLIATCLTLSLISAPVLAGTKKTVHEDTSPSQKVEKTVTSTETETKTSSKEVVRIQGQQTASSDEISPQDIAPAAGSDQISNRATVYDYNAE